MKSIIRKYFADRVLHEIGIDQDDFQCDSDGKVLYTKTASSVVYQSHDKGTPTEVIVTVDIAVRDLLRSFDLIHYEFGPYGTLDVGYPTQIDIDEVAELRVGRHYLFPVYVLETPCMASVLPGMPEYGPLRAQCGRARARWEEAQQQSIGVDFGFHMAYIATQFWQTVVQDQSLFYLQPLAEHCLSGEYSDSEYTPIIPDLSTANFVIHHDKVFPYMAVKSLAVYGLQQGKILYTKEVR